AEIIDDHRLPERLVYFVAGCKKENRKEGDRKYFFHDLKTACNGKGEPVGSWHLPANSAHAEDTGTLTSIAKLNPVRSARVPEGPGVVMVPLGRNFIAVIVFVEGCDEPMRRHGEFSQQQRPALLVLLRIQMLELRAQAVFGSHLP